MNRAAFALFGIPLYNHSGCNLHEFAAANLMTVETSPRAATRPSLATPLKRFAQGAAIALAALVSGVFFLALFPVVLTCWALVALRDHMRDWC
jgi:hypothetical protein